MLSTEPASVPSHQAGPFPDQLRRAVTAYLARFKGSSREHTESDLRCYLSWCAERGLDPARRAASPSGAVHPVDAGNPPVQALHHLPAVLRHGRVLPHQRHRRSPRAFTRRARPPSHSARRITHPGLHPPTVRGPAHRRPTVTGSMRLRAGGHARAARPADLRGHQRGRRRPRRRAWPPGAARVRQGHQDRPGSAAASRRPGDRPGGRRPHGGPVLLNSRGSRMDRRGHPPPALAPQPLVSRSPGHTRTCSGTRSSPPCSTQASTARCPDRRPPRRPAHHDALRQSPAEPGPTPELHLAAFMASGT